MYVALKPKAIRFSKTFTSIPMNVCKHCRYTKVWLKLWVLSRQRGSDIEKKRFLSIQNFATLLTGINQLSSGVARFFSVQHTKTGENIPNRGKLYQMVLKYTKWSENWQNGLKYTNIFYCKTLQNLPKSGIFVWKHLAALLLSSRLAQCLRKYVP
jgi:hypothetical protein